MDKLLLITFTVARLPIVVLSTILLLNLIGGFYRQNTDARFDETRRALFWLMLAVFLDSLLVMVAIIHDLFGNSVSAYQFIFERALFIWIPIRFLYLYGVFKFWKLFCCGKSKN